MTNHRTNAAAAPLTHALQPSTFASDLLLQYASLIRATGGADETDAIHGVGSLAGAVDFLQQAAQLLANGTPGDAPEVLQVLDFATRKMQQAAEELTGRRFALSL